MIWSWVRMFGLACSPSIDVRFPPRSLCRFPAEAVEHDDSPGDDGAVEDPRNALSPFAANFAQAIALCLSMVGDFLVSGSYRVCTLGIIVRCLVCLRPQQSRTAVSR